MEHSETRYLASKKSVDDRALNRGVLDRLRTELGKHAAARLNVLEIGAGLGTMVARLVDWDVLQVADYVLLDVDAASLREARNWLTDWAKRNGKTCRAEGDTLEILGGPTNLKVRLIEAELHDFLASGHGLSRADLLIANAFLDLVDVPHTLPALFELLVPGGLYYFTVNFDGETAFQPDHPADVSLMGAYHRSMDERVRYGRPAGDAHSGRHLFGHLRDAGASILAAGSSDWVVMAEGKTYPLDEAYFIEHILYTIEESLGARADVSQSVLREWLTVRREQLSRAELVYMTHQLDFVGRRR